MFRTLLMAAPLAALAACGEPSSSARVSEATDGVTVGVEVTDVWCRATPNGARAGGCFGEFRALGRADRLTSLTSPAAEAGEIHEVSTEGGIMRMTPLPDGLPLPQGERVRLAPGQDHLMLVGLKGPLVDGERVSMTLTFESGREMSLQVPVRRAPAP
ncbi:MAG: copper chaperone PCu(A)C [Alphaproteobacteria bacterium]|nr:copper chaperone PCu(A)C [Alphaproteobacteria bacterium]MBU1526207.1 copper chaperone PCu(A)C [Alphaproteobacteria bacterium]MBU2118416.1 copper chaperone PCu(A)C [Alphaproteobacteria bacterium]MBU2350559.1 copper chaperone PCu(A)C [Alphaproteobacteria bacterium]MBU2382114.1 copper chaperone PCu(A)C [Alphaproteobacteria bacterium]